METQNSRVYIAIDLKSFYASVECSERGLDALDTNLVVADESRTDKTICLAVTPSLKSFGIPGRARLFEVKEKLRKVNAQRLHLAPGRRFTGKSFSKKELDADPGLEADFVIARPRMAFYMDYSRRVFSIYTKYISFDDIHVYSVDEVFMDVTAYLSVYACTARELAMRIIRDVLQNTGITATAGIGTNMYLAKIAMDIVAKRMPADEDGVRIAELDEMSYRRELWNHRPLTDFWRVGRGYQRKLEANGMYTMGDIARCSVGAKTDHFNEELLYRLFGVNAETLIDHAWGWESCTIQDIKAYRADSSSLSSGQVLPTPYPHDKARLVLREMADQLSLELVKKGLAADQVSIAVNYDSENLDDPERARRLGGAWEKDFYGRAVPKPAHGSVRLGEHTSSTRRIVAAALKLYDDITDENLTVRRMSIAAGNVMEEKDVPPREPEQLSLFDDPEAEEEKRKADQLDLDREKKRQEALIEIRRRWGKNAIVMGMNLEDGATAVKRNSQIGGHRA